MIENFSSLKDLLQEELHRRIRINKRYSMRAFARDIGLSTGELSEVLRNLRPLSPRAAVKVANGLGLNRDETQDLVARAQFEREGKPLGAKPENSSAGHSVDLDRFHAVSDWYCFAILNLADTADFRWSFPWIGQRLGITATEAKLAVERLIRIGLIERDKTGALKVTHAHVFSAAGIPSEAIRNYHRQMLEKARQALETVKVEEREICGLGFSIHPAELDDAKKDIFRFVKQFERKYSRSKRKKEVYHLEVALFPLTLKRSSK